MNIEALRPIRIVEGKTEAPARITVDFAEVAILSTGGTRWEVREMEPGVLCVTLLDLNGRAQIEPRSTQMFVARSEP